MPRRILLSLLLVAACKHASSSSSETHTATQTTTESTSSETGNTTTVTTTSEAPGKTTTTIDEFAPPKEGDASVPDERGSSLQSDGGVPATPGVVSRPSHGPLVRRTVTVTERGAETTETHQQATTEAQAASEVTAAGKTDAKAQGHEEDAPAVGCAVAGWMWAVLIVAGIVGIILGALKMRKTVV